MTSLLGSYVSVTDPKTVECKNEVLCCDHSHETAFIAHLTPYLVTLSVGQNDEGHEAVCGTSIHDGDCTVHALLKQTFVVLA